jgi:orotidine-5'-phosphate decarboxylase
VKVAHDIPARERVIVALDVPDLAGLSKLLDHLGGRPAFYKVGLELFVGEGERAIELVRSRGGRVFLDLKLHDIPETVARAVAAGKVKILGVTVLTSLVEDDLRAEGIEQTIPEMVKARARIAARAGIAGLVCSPLEIEAARRAAPGLLIVVPGIRPAAGAGAAKGDQKRVATAGQAIAAGADYLVVGRPIRDAADPAAAFDDVVREVESAV